MTFNNVRAHEGPVAVGHQSARQEPGLSVRLTDISRNAIASYLISLYSSLAVLTADALAVLDDVEVGRYHHYGHTYR